MNASVRLAVSAVERSCPVDGGGPAAEHSAAAAPLALQAEISRAAELGAFSGGDAICVAQRQALHSILALLEQAKADLDLARRRA